MMRYLKFVGVLVVPLLLATGCEERIAVLEQTIKKQADTEKALMQKVDAAVQQAREAAESAAAAAEAAAKAASEAKAAGDKADRIFQKNLRK